MSDLALKRVKQDLTMHGGQVCCSIVPATHLVVVSVLQTYNFDILYKRYRFSFFSIWKRRYLLNVSYYYNNNQAFYS
jgi:hypothetical protein